MDGNMYGFTSQPLVRMPNAGPSNPPVDINNMLEKAGNPDEEIPVFNGPVYNLESAVDLPQPVESSQRVECMEGDPEDPYSPKRYRVVTTHILPPVFIYSNAAAKRITAAAEQSGLIPEQPPCGELYVERVSPDSLAPWLLLLESKTPFVVHEVDPQHENTKSLANPQGILPTWVDADGTCIWGAHAVMRFIADKHGLPIHFYPHDNLNLRGRVNIALDWCSTVLAPHVQQLLEPDAFERSDLHDAATAKLLLDKDLRVLINYFLQETLFIGGDKLCIADISIAMHLLLLYATDYLPNAKVREYLHRCADFCDTWNDVTTSMRDYCIQRHHLRVRLHIEHEAMKGHGDLNSRAEQDERRQAELSERMRLEEEEWQRKLDEEKRQLAEESRRKLEEDAHRRREEDEKRAREDNERRRRAEKEWADRLEAEKRRLLEEDRRLREEEERRRRGLMDRRREEEERRRKALEDERRRREEEERLRREAADKAKGVEWKPMIGVEIKMLDDQQGNKDCVVVCHAITPDGPAQKAGILAEDIIDAWNGEALRSKDAWTDHVKNSRPGNVVDLSIIRGSEKMAIPVTIGATMKKLGGTRTVKSSTKLGQSKTTTTTTRTTTRTTTSKAR